MKNTTLAEALLAAFLIRLLVTGASVGDAIALISLSALYGYQKYLKASEIADPTAEIVARMTAIEEQNKKLSSKIDAQAFVGRR